MRRSQRDCSPLSLLIVDIDYFKQVNDTYGHSGEDELIRCVASIRKITCLAGLLVAGRLGGVKFTVLMSQTNALAAWRWPSACVVPSYLGERQRQGALHSRHRQPQRGRSAGPVTAPSTPS